MCTNFNQMNNAFFKKTLFIFYNLLFLFSLIIQQHTHLRIFPTVQCTLWTAIILISFWWTRTHRDLEPLLRWEWRCSNTSLCSAQDMGVSWDACFSKYLCKFSKVLSSRAYIFKGIHYSNRHRQYRNPCLMSSGSWRAKDITVTLKHFIF